MARTPKLRSVDSSPASPKEPSALSEKMRLTADRILVKVPDESERRSKAGLLIPATAAHPIKRCLWSQVVLVGPEVRNIRTGDEILFLPQTGLEMEFQGDGYLLLRERDVQAIASSRGDGFTSGQYL
jgi:chaperonin GroES